MKITTTILKRIPKAFNYSAQGWRSEPDRRGAATLSGVATAGAAPPRLRWPVRHAPPGALQIIRVRNAHQVGGPPEEVFRLDEMVTSFHGLAGERFAAYKEKSTTASCVGRRAHLKPWNTACLPNQSQLAVRDCSRSRQDKRRSFLPCAAWLV